MKKINIQSLVCTIEQGKKLDELLGRVGQYSDNLFWWYKYNSQEPRPGYGAIVDMMQITGDVETICNAYCDAELDQLFPREPFSYKGKLWRIMHHVEKNYEHCCTMKLVEDPYNEHHQIHMSYKTGAQSKAQCLIWLIENTGYKPQID